MVAYGFICTACSHEFAVTAGKAPRPPACPACGRPSRRDWSHATARTTPRLAPRTTPPRSAAQLPTGRWSGGFTIDGNGIATHPVVVCSGADRTFVDMGVTGSADVGMLIEQGARVTSIRGKYSGNRGADVDNAGDYEGYDDEIG